MDPLLKGECKKGGRKTVGVKLNENDLAILNLRLRQDKFNTLNELYMLTSIKHIQSMKRMNKQKSC